ncbi:MAG: histidine kinase [Candidatus Accumulibacter sp.]|jgi:two-component system sensor histidine kinase AlgZ|nr:histidine kinase [Accumulibacter sp.]
MTDAKQKAESVSLPDFGNFGVMLRILLGANFFAFGMAIARSAASGGELGGADPISQYLELSIRVQPLLILNILVLALVGGTLSRWPLRAAQAAIVLFAAASSTLLENFFTFMESDTGSGHLLSNMLLAGGIAGLLLYYFELRARAFSPAVSEARLQALTARIRPHFLFNSLNAVLSLIRTEPERAEMALEALAELFRVMMRDHRELLPLFDEIDLCRQYLELEKLRLGERLTVVWEIPETLPDVKVPQLMMQPLLENAIYYGIEPLSDGGVVRIRLNLKDDEIRIELSNPHTGANQSCKTHMTAQEGNHMAIANIRERLALHYDLEARLETEERPGPDGGNEYRVRIVLPCRS